MIDIHKPGVIGNLMRQVGIAEKNLQIQQQQQIMLLHSSLTPEEKEKYNERVHRQVLIGGVNQKSAELTTLQSILNMRQHTAAVEEAGKQVHEGMKQLFDNAMLNVVAAKDKVEIKDQENRDKYGSLKRE